MGFRIGDTKFFNIEKPASRTFNLKGDIILKELRIKCQEVEQKLRNFEKETRLTINFNRYLWIKRFQYGPIAPASISSQKLGFVVEFKNMENFKNEHNKELQKREDWDRELGNRIKYWKDQLRVAELTDKNPLNPQKVGEAKNKVKELIDFLEANPEHNEENEKKWFELKERADTLWRIRMEQKD